MTKEEGGNSGIKEGHYNSPSQERMENPEQENPMSTLFKIILTCKESSLVFVLGNKTTRVQ